MSISQAIAPHLPQLRRFARALTGSQKGGDAYVVETLEAIVADPDNLDASADVRCGLYKLFLKLWNSVSVNTLTDSAGATSEEMGASRHLEAISLLPRVALLLTALEGFDIGEVARTLD